MAKVTELTAKLALPVVEEAGCELWDVARRRRPVHPRCSPSSVSPKASAKRSRNQETSSISIPRRASRVSPAASPNSLFPASTSGGHGKAAVHAAGGAAARLRAHSPGGGRGGAPDRQGRRQALRLHQMPGGGRGGEQRIRRRRRGDPGGPAGDGYGGGRNFCHCISSFFAL
mgnify:CR=1 FL=1